MEGRLVTLVQAWLYEPLSKAEPDVADDARPPSTIRYFVISVGLALSLFLLIAAAAAQASPITYNWITTDLETSIPFTFSSTAVFDSSAVDQGTLIFSKDCFLSGPVTCTDTGNTAAF